MAPRLWYFVILSAEHSKIQKSVMTVVYVLVILSLSQDLAIEGWSFSCEVPAFAGMTTFKTICHW
jgi:hypothetical protein